MRRPERSISQPIGTANAARPINPSVVGRPASVSAPLNVAALTESSVTVAMNAALKMLSLRKIVLVMRRDAAAWLLPCICMMNPNRIDDERISVV